MGVTAVLNAAQGSMTDWNYVNTKAIYYTGVGIEFFGVPAIDLKWYPICNHFQEASNFIEEVIKSKGKYEFFFMCIILLCANSLKPAVSRCHTYIPTN